MFRAARQPPAPRNPDDPVIVVGGGLAGLVAAFELTRRRVRCVVVDQENAANLGGQAFWSLGGLFVVDSAFQRFWGIRDSRELALADWLNSARFDRDRDDRWPRRWAQAFVDFATDHMESYVKERGISFLQVSWPERGDGTAEGHGNSVPRFHIAWGAGPAVVEGFAAPVRQAAADGLVEFRFRHRVDELVRDDETGRCVGVRGAVLEPCDDLERGKASSRTVVGPFELRGRCVLVATGGIGGDVEKVKKAWPVGRLGDRVPQHFVVGVPAYVDGRMIDIARGAGASVINSDRMWHYTEGLANWDPIWPDHGIRILPAPSSLWLDATGQRLPAPFFPGCDTLGTLKYICSTGYDYTWFVTDRAIVSKEFALSGSEQNPDLTGKNLLQLVRERLFNSFGTTPVANFAKHGKDFVVRDTLEELVRGMNELAATVGGPQLDAAAVRKLVDDQNLQRRNPYSKDAQLMMMENGRKYAWDRWTRIAKTHEFGDPKCGPLIAVRLNLLTRKTLGGLETDLDSAVLRPDGERFDGLYAAGEAAGFGGGGVHGYSSLEGTFLGGCIFSGRAAGLAMAREVIGEDVPPEV